MKKLNTDVAVIGAGSAGLNARREAERNGASWVMIESGPFGTTCARVGCMPSKLLIAAADRAHEIQHAGPLGIDVEEGGWRVDGPAVFDRVRRERDRFAGFVVRSTEALPEEQVIRGRARFTGPTTLQIDDHTVVEAKSVVIATGSTPWIPPQLEGVREHLMVNDDVFELEDVPESVAVFGTGVIGLELGQALGRLGARVVFFNPFDVIGYFTDPVLVAKTKEVLGESLELRIGHEPGPVTRGEDGTFTVTWTDEDGEHSETFTHVLAAAGRRPNLAGLGLEHTGLTLDRRGMPSFDAYTMQCEDSPIFVAGDVNNDRPLLHEASDEGRIAGFNAARVALGTGEVAARPRRTPLAIAFTDPQMAMVGKSFAQLEAGTFEAGEVSYDNQGRARVMGVNSGHVRIYASREGCRLVGAEMFGPRVEHTAHLLAWAIQQGMTVQEALAMPFYHPVVEEGIRTALRDLKAKLRRTGTCPPEDFAFHPSS